MFELTFFKKRKHTKEFLRGLSEISPKPQDSLESKDLSLKREAILVYLNTQNIKPDDPRENIIRQIKDGWKNIDTDMVQKFASKLKDKNYEEEVRRKIKKFFKSEENEYNKALNAFLTKFARS